MPAKILIVEDQHAEMIQSLLKLHAGASSIEQQFEFKIARDGFEALKRLDEPDLPDLILLDLRLPGVPGLAVLDAIRIIDKNLPVIVVSAYGDRETRDKANAHGANDFYQKPINAMRLFQRIKMLLIANNPHRQPQDSKYDTIALDSLKLQTFRRQQRLFKLRERQALLGIDSPPELVIEIEDLEEELRIDEQKRKSLGGK